MVCIVGARSKLGTFTAIIEDDPVLLSRPKHALPRLKLDT